MSSKNCQNRDKYRKQGRLTEKQRREREHENDRETKTKTEGKTDRDRQTDRNRDRQSVRASLGILPSPRAFKGRNGWEFIQVPKPISMGRSWNFSKSQSLYSRWYSFIFSAFHHIPSYFLHLSL